MTLISHQYSEYKQYLICRQEPAAYNTNPIRNNPQLHRTGQSGHRAAEVNSHLHNQQQQEQIDRSRVDFLYYDGGNPEYEYYYYEDGDYNELEVGGATFSFNEHL